MDQARIHPCPHDDGYFHTQGIHHRVCSDFVFLWQLSLITYLPLLYLFTCRNRTDSNIRTFADVVGGSVGVARGFLRGLAFGILSASPAAPHCDIAENASLILSLIILSPGEPSSMPGPTLSVLGYRHIPGALPPVCWFYGGFPCPNVARTVICGIIPPGHTPSPVPHPPGVRHGGTPS
jgi:hypothetical protein